jgi:hypothetical protein
VQLQTIIDIPKPAFQISHKDRLMFVGSCFADNIGQKFTTSGFQTLVNPFGTIYNPASIATLLLRCISERECTEIFPDDQGVWHSWLHHSRFSAPSSKELQQRIAQATHEATVFLANASVLCVTLGTAYIYRLESNGMLVSNCHKQPDQLFRRERMTPYDIVDQWQILLQLLQALNPELRIIITVSPIRHKRDGLHANQISKGILLQAADEICTANTDLCTYFPSYEIMLDELRDYRFYADDMIHPSELAIEYIWQRLQQTYMNTRTIDKCLKQQKQWRGSQHRTIIE